MDKVTTLFLLFSVLVTGCQTLPPLSFSVADVRPAKVRMDAELKTVNVRAARPDEMTGNNRAADFEKATG